MRTSNYVLPNWSQSTCPLNLSTSPKSIRWLQKLTLLPGNLLIKGMAREWFEELTVLDIFIWYFCLQQDPCININDLQTVDPWANSKCKLNMCLTIDVDRKNLMLCLIETSGHIMDNCHLQIIWFDGLYWSSAAKMILYVLTSTLLPPDQSSYLDNYGISGLAAAMAFHANQF